MKYFVIYFGIIIFLSCKKKPDKKNHISVSIEKKCEHNRIMNKFKDDIFENNESLSNLRQYFIFPFEDEKIWDLISFNSNSDFFKKNREVFSENDFYKYKKFIFSSDFKTAINNFKWDILFEKGHYNTMMYSNYEEEEEYSFKLMGNYEKNKIVLILYYELKEDTEKYEVSINYIFNFNEKCKLKLGEIILAG